MVRGKIFAEWREAVEEGHKSKALRENFSFHRGLGRSRTLFRLRALFGRRNFAASRTERSFRVATIAVRVSERASVCFHLKIIVQFNSPGTEVSLLPVQISSLFSLPFEPLPDVCAICSAKTGSRRSGIRSGTIRGRGDSWIGADVIAPSDDFFPDR